MASFEVWDIVKVPFPYTDRPIRQKRPALVIAADHLKREHGLLWLLMITSAANRGWDGDVPVSDLASAGLPAPSIIRPAKVATIEAADAERLGSLATVDRDPVARYVETILSTMLQSRAGDRH